MEYEMKKALRYLLQISSLLMVLSTCVLGQGAVKQNLQAKTAPSADVSDRGRNSAVVEHLGDSYIIGKGDLLAINVWNEPELQQSIPVRPDGRISLPLIGGMQAAGLTPLQLQESIAAKLDAYINHPTVSVIVKEINSQNFNILGRVMKPGSYPLSTSMTVLDGIAAAGGFQDFAKKKSIYVLRTKPGGGEVRLSFNYKDVIKGKHMEQNITLEPHDTIIVP